MIHLARFGKREYVVGLWWQTLSTRSGAIAQIRKIAADVDGHYDACAIIPDHPHAGLANTGGDRRFLARPSLAAAVAARKSSLLGLFRIPGGFWLLAISEQFILPDGDLFERGDRELSSRFTQFQQIGRFDEVVDHCDDEERSIAYIDELLKQIKHPPALRPLYYKPPLLPIVALVLLAAGAGSGWYFWNRYKTAQAAAAAAALAAAQASRTLDGEATRVFPKPWLDTPLPGAVLALCETLREVPLVRKGWRVSRWHCNATGVTLIWDRLTNGRFTERPFQARFNERRPNTASSRIQADAAPGNRAERELSDKGDALARFYELARARKLRSSVNWNEPPPPLPGARPSDNPEPVAPYTQAQWSLNSDSPPFSGLLNQGLDAIPGLVVTQFTRKDNQWEIKGEMYVNR